MNATAAAAIVPAGGLLHTAGALLLILGLIFALAWFARRLQGLRPAAGGALRIEGGIQVGTRERVLWVRAGDKHLLIGVAPGRVQTLHVFDEPPRSEAPTMPPPPVFGDLLRRALGKEST